MHEAFRKDEDPGALTLLCERQGLSFEHLARIRYRFEHGERVTLDFNTADRILCGLGKWNLWYEDFNAYYVLVDLNWSQCECPGCTVMVHNVTDKKGVRRRYCSKTCCTVASRIRRGKQQRRLKHNQETHCRNGHRWEPGSFIMVADGRGGEKKRCRQCQHDANRRAYLKRMAA